MHARLFPKKNNFRYGIYYFSLPLSKLNKLPFAHNRFGLTSFHDKDHGPCDGTDLQCWARDILSTYNIEAVNGGITLVCMPRIFGYVFNPVSFWLCHDKSGDLRAIICEVHNTFGEHHHYLCAHEDHRPIIHTDVLEGEKLFHVSPFLEREGHYSFRFDMRAGKFGAWIDYFDASGKKKLVTSLIGECSAMTRISIQKAFWRYPLVTLKAVFLIHWQALKLIVKGIKYISKPRQKTKKDSVTRNLTKM